LGSIGIFDIATSEQIVERTARAARKSRDQYYILVRAVGGTLELTEYGRSSVAQTGDCILVDTKAPFTLKCSGQSAASMLRFKNGWLKNWIGTPEDVVARTISCRSGWGRTLSAALDAANLLDEAEFSAIPVGVAEQLAALLALTTQNVCATSDHRTTPILERARRAISDCCWQPGITAEKIASDIGISTRYLHKIFFNAQTTFRTELIEMRLGHAHRMLSDRAFMSISISEIATRSGFSDISHFSRRFSQKYRLPPDRFRRQTLSR